MVWARSTTVLDRERAIYDDLPPAVDIMELFAGEAGVTSRASRYGLSASEPVDQVESGLWMAPRDSQTQDYRWSSGCGPMSSTWPTPAPCTPSSMRTSTTASAWTYFIAYGETIWKCDVSFASCWIFSLMAAAPSSLRIRGAHDSERWTILRPRRVPRHCAVHR